MMTPEKVCESLSTLAKRHISQGTKPHGKAAIFRHIADMELVDRLTIRRFVMDEVRYAILASDLHRARTWLLIEEAMMRQIHKVDPEAI